MNILVLNCGSSSVKFQVIHTDANLIEHDGDKCLARGLVELAGPKTQVTLQAGQKPPVKETIPVNDYHDAIAHVLEWIVSPEAGLDGVRSLSDIHAVGHRLVHGGEKFQASVLIDDKVIEAVEECSDLAPLHNPPNLKGVRASLDVLGPNVPNVGVFDTAFHATMPETSFIYGLPYEYYSKHKVRRYGFHGTSHRYVAYHYQKMLGLPDENVNIVTLHLGNGCSACAIRQGKSFNTSMGLTPLEGLLMGTRVGDIDTGALFYIAQKEGLGLQELDKICNKKSGLLGISGSTNDMRGLLEREAKDGDKRAKLAVDIFCGRIKRYIGGYIAEMGGADAVIFTGGIGERSAPVRKRICEGLGCIGLLLDDGKNERVMPGEIDLITRRESRLKAYVIPTNEELLIARDTFQVMGSLANTR
jgi:acetate kinase